MGYTPHVLVIGGGVLGTAIARDFAIRGLDVTLLEQGHLSAGTTARMQGVLYSGAQFVTDEPGDARRCWRENRVLRRIADHCIEETGGVILPPEDEDAEEIVDTCEQHGISVSRLPADQLDHDYPEIADGFDDAIRTRDAVVDPFRLTLANAAGARNYGAEIKTGARVVDFREEDEQLAGVEIEFTPSTQTTRAPTSALDWDTGEDDANDSRASETAPETTAAATEAEPGDESEDETGAASEANDTPEMPGEIQRSFPGASVDDESEPGEREEIDADFVVNAAGAWADRVAALAGIRLPLSRSRGAMLVLEGSQASAVVTHLRAEDSHTITPYQGNTVVGPVEETSDGDPVTALLAATQSIVPATENAPVLRTYAGVWTQHASSTGTPAGPGATLVDHKRYDDTWGLLSVVGGTLTTHRLIAEKAVDRVCSEFGIDRECLTDEIPLPRGAVSRPSESAGTARAGEADDPILCETRSVTRDAVQAALEDSEDPTNLETVRMRTGATMGACQGGRCGHRIASELHPEHDPVTVETSLSQLLEARWQGRRGVLRGEQLAAAMADYEFHTRDLGRDSTERGVDPGRFAGRSTATKRDRQPLPRDELFVHAPDLGFLDPTPVSEGGRVMCCEGVSR